MSSDVAHHLLMRYTSSVHTRMPYQAVVALREIQKATGVPTSFRLREAALDIIDAHREHVSAETAERLDREMGRA